MKDEVRAYRWWCGDDICDCTQYRIEQVHEEGIPGSLRGTRFRFRTLWEGRFRSDSTWIERHEQAEDLRHYRKAARRFGVSLVTERFSAPHGERPATPSEVQEMVAELREAKG